jgi:hypothetical protein
MMHFLLSKGHRVIRYSVGIIIVVLLCVPPTFLLNLKLLLPLFETSGSYKPPGVNTGHFQEKKRELVSTVPDMSGRGQPACPKG